MINKNFEKLLKISSFIEVKEEVDNKDKNWHSLSVIHNNGVEATGFYFLPDLEIERSLVLYDFLIAENDSKIGEFLEKMITYIEENKTKNNVDFTFG